MQITQNQVKALIDEKGNARKCPECRIKDRVICVCQGTGKATIKIEKEWIECDCLCHIKGKIAYCNCAPEFCKDGKIPKYKVNEEIKLPFKIRSIDTGNIIGNKIIKLKIISETENEWKVCLA